ncbi:hypothetical protein NL676_008186 [Syzygium grande]|nr:hypothetical protein NL676_008186 [Syzygium grande]
MGTYKSRNGWKLLRPSSPVAAPLDGGDVAADAVPGPGDDHAGAPPRRSRASARAMRSHDPTPTTTQSTTPPAALG